MSIRSLVFLRTVAIAPIPHNHAPPPPPPPLVELPICRKFSLMLEIQKFRKSYYTKTSDKLIDDLTRDSVYTVFIGSTNISAIDTFWFN